MAYSNTQLLQRQMASGPGGPNHRRRAQPGHRGCDRHRRACRPRRSGRSAGSRCQGVQGLACSGAIRPLQDHAQGGRDHARAQRRNRAAVDDGARQSKWRRWRRPTSSNGSPRKPKRAYRRVIPARGPGIYQIAIKEPVGPVAAFTPWNFPINQVVRKISAGLAAGCSIIVKAPEETPASPAQLIRAFVDAGVPDGVLNLVYGVPAEISEYLIPHPIIHRFDRGRQAALGAGGPAHEAGNNRTRRPCAGHCVQRC
jgi:hypothetical protein